ncbi:MAG TPA: TetR family transcriptional regulator [Nocardioides sp.]
MVRDSQATRGRLLDAAHEEFARHGLAGARVARIAQSAGANKQLIYAYFGDKVGLFDAVLARQQTDVLQAVPLDPADVVGYVGTLFDYIADHPDVMRLAAWKKLERPATADGIGSLGWMNELVRAREDGQIAASFDARNLELLLFGLASSWDVLSLEGTSEVCHETGNASRARFRRDLLEAARRIIQP